jgi:hypothetical protein
MSTTTNIHAIPVHYEPRARPPRPPRDRRRATLLLLGLTAFVTFVLGQLSVEVVDLPHSPVRSIFIAAGAVACSWIGTLLLAIHLGRQHADARTEVRALREELIHEREVGYAMGYVDGVGRKPPREFRSSPLRPVV